MAEAEKYGKVFKREYSAADVHCATPAPPSTTTTQLSLPFEFCTSPPPSALRQLLLCWPASKRMADSSEWVFNFTCLTTFPANNWQCQAGASGQEGQNVGPAARGGGFVLPLLVNKPQGDLMRLEQGYCIMHVVLTRSVFNLGKKTKKQNPAGGAAHCCCSEIPICQTRGIVPALAL